MALGKADKNNKLTRLFLCRRASVGHKTPAIYESHEPQPARAPVQRDIVKQDTTGTECSCLIHCHSDFGCFDVSILTVTASQLQKINVNSVSCDYAYFMPIKLRFVAL